MEIIRTRIVSFPRSGHHWLLRMLRSNLGSSIRYGNPLYDGFTLETHPYINVQTEHDQNLDAPINPDFQHIIQWRDKNAAFESWWRMQCCPRQEERKASNRIRRSDMYDRWVAKWVRADIPNAMRIRYEDMVENPMKELQRAYTFLTGIEPPILVVELPHPHIGHYDQHTD